MKTVVQTPDSPKDLPELPQTKRRAILDAAAVVFSEEGFAGASIDQIASKAGVSRQTVYNQIGDKEKLFHAVVAEISEKSSARLFEVMEQFPVAPADLEAELTAFSAFFLRRAMCDPNGRRLRKLLEAEAVRYPQLFSTWKEYGPGKKYPAIAARLAQLAHAGYLDLDDPNVAARQFVALLGMDIKTDIQFGRQPSDEELDDMAKIAMRTFVKAYARR